MVTWAGSDPSLKCKAVRRRQGLLAPSRQLNGSVVALQVNRYPLPLLREALDAQVPCSRKGCPLGTDIPALVAAVARGEHAKAYGIARASNPFASTCGHGCHAPCETACRRRRSGAPVAIAGLEAYAAALSTPSPDRHSGPCTSPHDLRSIAASSRDGAIANSAEAPLRVAIVGGGAAGLACAHDLALLGHQPVVLDAGHEPGGILTRILPAFRFPVTAARAECLSILAGGVSYHPGTAIVDRAGIDTLFNSGFAAVLLAIGCWKQPAAHLANSHDAMEFLAHDHAIVGDSVVIGDGDLAVDAVREVVHRARRLGRSQRTDLVLTARLEEATAVPHAIAAAMREGVVVHAGWLPARMHHDAARGLTSLEITRDGGRTNRVLTCAHVLDARTRVPDMSGLDLALDGDGYIAVDPDTFQTSQPAVWAAGSCAFGHRSIAHAVADGKRAAWQIHAAITGRRLRAVLTSAWVEADDHAVPAERGVSNPRTALPSTGPVPADPFSPSSQPDHAHLVAEASRCFDCTVLPIVDEECTGCGMCVGACEPRAITLSGQHGIAVIDGERCTRCTACVDSCPEGAITLARTVWEDRLSLQASAPSGIRVDPFAPAARLTPR